LGLGFRIFSGLCEALADNAPCEREEHAPAAPSEPETRASPQGRVKKLNRRGARPRCCLA
jgi:hypothetical protein